MYTKSDRLTIVIHSVWFLHASERGALVNIVEFRQRPAASSRDDVNAIVEQFRQEANRRQSLADLATLGLAHDGVVRLRAAVGALMLLVRQLGDSDLEFLRSPPCDSHTPAVSRAFRVAGRSADPVRARRPVCQAVFYAPALLSRTYSFP